MRIVVGNARLLIRVSIENADDDRRQLAETLHSRLSNLAIQNIPAISEIVRWIEEHAADGRIKDAVLLRGIDPTPAQDGYIKWERDFFSPGFMLDERTDRVLYRERKSSRAVCVGQKLCEIVDPVAGADGTDVFGNPIKAGPPSHARLEVGEGVTADATRHVFSSTRDGRLSNSKETIWVDEVFVIDASVGIETGNIEHNGALDIYGDILQDSKVRSRGSITVSKGIEPSVVETKSDLDVVGGIWGDADSRVYAGGDLHTLYIQEAQVHCVGCITVAREILNSEVSCGEALTVLRGRIVGGRTTAGAKISAHKLGSPNAIKTKVVISSTSESETERKKVIALERVYPATTIVIDQRSKTFLDEIPGPVEFYLKDDEILTRRPSSI